jgi:hypothetical protein
VNVKKNKTPDSSNEPTTNVARILERTPMRRGRRRRMNARTRSMSDERSGRIGLVTTASDNQGRVP